MKLSAADGAEVLPPKTETGAEVLLTARREERGTFEGDGPRVVCTDIWLMQDRFIADDGTGSPLPPPGETCGFRETWQMERVRV